MSCELFSDFDAQVLGAVGSVQCFGEDREVGDQVEVVLQDERQFGIDDELDRLLFLVGHFVVQHLRNHFPGKRNEPQSVREHLRVPRRVQDDQSVGARQKSAQVLCSEWQKLDTLSVLWKPTLERHHAR